MTNVQIYKIAFDHCRSTSVLDSTINSSIDKDNYLGKTFEEIFVDIDDICRDVKDLGILAIYDITISILKYHGVKLDVTYLVGSGDKIGAEKAGLTNFTKTKKIGRHKLPYIENIYIFI